MPEWAMTLLVSGGGLVMVAGGAKAWWSAWREDRKAKRDGMVAEKRSLEERADRLQGKVESLLMDAIAREREHNAQQADRIAMDAKQNEVIITATTALKEAAVLMAKIEKGAT